MDEQRLYVITELTVNGCCKTESVHNQFFPLCRIMLMMHPKGEIEGGYLLMVNYAKIKMKIFQAIWKKVEM